MMIHEPSEVEYKGLIGGAEFAVVLMDTVWDVGPGAKIRPLFEEAAREYGERVLFAAIDCEWHIPLMRALPLGNVPTVAYYRGGRLVAAVIGASQDVAGRTRALLDGRPIRLGDGCDGADPFHPRDRAGGAPGWIGRAARALNAWADAFRSETPGSRAKRVATGGGEGSQASPPDSPCRDGDVA